MGTITVETYMIRLLVKKNNVVWLVLWNIFLFFHILGIIIPTDFHIFQRGRSITNHIHRSSIDHPKIFHRNCLDHPAGFSLDYASQAQFHILAPLLEERSDSEYIQRSPLAGQVPLGDPKRTMTGIHPKFLKS